jgi:predicted Zn-dependent peptidase
MWRHLVLFVSLAFPVLAQEVIETPAGPVSAFRLSNGTSVVTQLLPERPLCCITLTCPWGRSGAGQPLLNRTLARTSPNYPGGSLLVSLEQIGGQSTFVSGQDQTSFSLIVPRAYAAWALDVQLARLSGSWTKGLDSSLQSHFLSQFQPSRCALSVVGHLPPEALRPRLNQLALKSAPAQTPTPPSGAPPDFKQARLAWKFAWPPQLQAQAAIYLWKAALEESGVGEMHDLGQAYFWVSSPAASPELARQKLQNSLPEPLQISRLRPLARQIWWQEWDDLSRRSRRLAQESLAGQLGRSLQFDPLLATYSESNWKRDSESLLRPEQELWLEPVSDAQGLPPLRGKPGPPPKALGTTPNSAFVRLEWGASRSALVQQLSGAPLIGVRALLPGGQSLDLPSQAGRAESLASTWQQALSRSAPTRVEAQVYGWECSTILPRELWPEWSQSFFSLLQQPCPPVVNPPVQTPTPLESAYAEWLQKLFPAEHPLGRLYQSQSPLPERVQELHREVQRRGRFHLMLSGDIRPAEVEASWQKANVSEISETFSAPWENLPTQSSLPNSVLERSAPVKQASLLLGGLAPSRRESDYYAFVLLLQSLAGDPLRSRLHLELRHRHSLAQRVEANLLSSSGPSPWLIRIDCAAEQLGPVRTKLEEILQRTRSQEIRPDELARVVSRLEGLQQTGQIDSSGRLNLLRNQELFRLSDSYSEDFAGLYRAIKSKDLLLTAKSRLAPERLVMMVISPQAR